MPKNQREGVIKLKIEIRSTSEIHISGYVNAVERDSRVLPAEMSRAAASPFVEKVAAGAFRRAIERNPNVRMLFNHEREIGSVGGGQLKLTEDNIGLHAEAVITDSEVVAAAKRGELRGWSFGFSGAKDRWEQYREGVQRRTLEDFTLAEVSILTKTPAYFGTSVELRGEDCDVLETRACDDAQEAVNTEILPDNSDSSPDRGYFSKQIEILKMKGEIL